MAERFTVEHGGSPVTEALINKLKSIGQHLNPESNDLACIPFWYKYRSKIIEAELLALICGIFPDGFRIPIQDLVSYGMSLDLFENVHDMFTARCRVHNIISTYNDKKYPWKATGGQIRLAPEKDGPLDQYVKMLVGSHGVAKSIAPRYPLAFRQETLIRNWPESDWFADCYGLSLVLRKVAEHPVNLEFPKLTLLRLQYREDSQSIPIDFFKSMKELCVLSLDLPSLPHSLKVSRNLKALRLIVPRLEDMSWIGSLINLEFLLLSVSSLSDIPRELGKLQNLRLLDLRKMNIAYFPPGVLSRLLKLEELYLPLNFSKWECNAKQCDDSNDWESGEQNYEDEVRIRSDSKIDGRINTSPVEILSPSLNALQICVPHASFLPKKSPIFRNIREFNISTPYNAFCQPFGMYSMNVLQFTGEACDIEESVICDLLSKAEELSLTGVRNLRNVIYQLAEGFPQLQKMIIAECNELEFVVDTTEKKILSEGDNFFRKLECLHLSMLSSLKEICHGRWKNLSWFSNLSQISIRFCPKLTYVFPLSIVRGLTLKSVEILDCHEMKGIFYEDGDNIPLTQGSIEKLELHSLPWLISFLVRKDDKIDGVENDIDLSLTPDEVSVAKYKDVVSHMDMEVCSAFSSRFAVKWFRNLKSLKIAFCDLVTVVFLFEGSYATPKAFNSLEVLELHGLRNLVHIWFQTPPKMTSFKNLQLLVLTDCGSLYLFSYRVAKLLVQLQKVYVSRCEKMEKVIIQKDVEIEGKGRIVLPKLKLLELQHMPNLEILFSVSCDIELPLFEHLKVKKCNKMKSISDGLLNIPMLENIEIDGSSHLVTRDYNFIFTGVPTPQRFTFADLKIATKDFSSDNFLGQGSFGKVYKGWIDRKTYAPSKTSTGMSVAVKIHYSYRRDCVKRELRTVGRLSHPNLLKLLGHYLEDKLAAVVYEFVPGGTLYDRLFTGETLIEPLTWDMRIKIAIGAARGINYLHTSEPKVIHRDIKPHNMLLDADHNPKISDFGLAIFGSSVGRFGEHTTSIAGTWGYIAPETEVSGRVSVKADVYSFGVVLFELMTNVKAFFDWTDEKFSTTLGAWLELRLPTYKDVKDLIVAWMRIQQGSSDEAKLLMADLILDCTKIDPELRPTMAQVLYKLCKIDAIIVQDLPELDELPLLELDELDFESIAGSLSFSSLER